MNPFKKFFDWLTAPPAPDKPVHFRSTFFDGCASDCQCFDDMRGAGEFEVEEWV